MGMAEYEYYDSPASLFDTEDFDSIIGRSMSLFDDETKDGTVDACCAIRPMSEKEYRAAMKGRGRGLDDEDVDSDSDSDDDEDEDSDDDEESSASDEENTASDDDDDDDESDDSSASDEDE